jgi:hypothetical protein
VTLFSRLVGRPPRPKALRRARPTLVVLEDRALPSGFSAIQANFNAAAIPAGNTVWFNSAVKVAGLGSTPATLHLVNSAIDFTANGASYHLVVPDADITFLPTATAAETTFDSENNRWETTAPSAAGGNVFLAGLALPVTSGLPGLLPVEGGPLGGLLGGLLGPLTSALPGNISPTWSGTFRTDAPGLTVTWQWSAAVYARFGSDNDSLGVKPADGNQLSAYRNSDPAGTPESFRNAVRAGARGAGGSNYTGTPSGPAQVAPDFVPPPPPPAPTGSLSGAVLDITTGVGLSGVTITLSWADASGQEHSLSTTTDDNGGYSFTGLGAATYSITMRIRGGYQDEADANQVGSLGGSTSLNTFSGIVLNDGDQGVNYTFMVGSQS